MLLQVDVWWRGKLDLLTNFMRPYCSAEANWKCFPWSPLQ